MALKRSRHRGLFITLEGPEGSGKSSHIRHLAAALTRAGYTVAHTREPGGTPAAEAIRNMLLTASSHEPISPVTEALLILAARSQHVTQVIEPALQRGAIVLCDRFSDSTLAYQGFARGIDRSWLIAANNEAAQGLSPDLTLLLDVPVAVGLARRQKARRTQNRLDRESRSFHHAVRRGFLALARLAPRRIRIIDANRSEHTVRAEVESFVLAWVRRRRPLARHRRSHALPR